MAKLTLVQALNLAFRQEMERDPSVIILGEDVGKDGGVFRVTEGLYEKFGDQRVIDTPLAESGIVGTSIGLSLNGMKPVAEIQFDGFCYVAFHQIESHAARFRQRSHGRYHCPMVIRMPYGAGIHALEHHSESREAYFAHTPGLKMVIPSSPRKARGLLTSAIRDPDPVIFFEPKALYRSVREEVDESVEESYPLGKAEVTKEGKDITLIAYGAMMRPTMQAAEELESNDKVSAEVIDLLTISPMDSDTIVESVKKTGRAVVIHEAPRNCGVGAEVIARIVEKAFLYLEAPVRRLTGYDVHTPYFAREKYYLPDKERIVHIAKETLSF
ncbi:MAG: alpha-ketoacid dehydrogenase subunit beta [Deltaproteobacteria bacterium]|nr:alpha-ketoacid dehydrogenase subunit beta [Deltaproteobacteria bacterium]